MSDKGPKIWRSDGALSVLGMGRALPPLWLTQPLLDHVDAQFGLRLAPKAKWIAQRLNIQSRHLSRAVTSQNEAALPGASNAELAARALQVALDEAELDVNDLGYLLAHTTTPQTLLPANIGHVAELLGYRGPFAEFRQACVGFGSALAFAFGLLSRADASPIAIVGSECGSLSFDPALAAQDNGQLVNFVQMGDAAAAIVLGPAGKSGAAQIDSVFNGQIGWNRAPGFALNPLQDGGLAFSHDFKNVREYGLALFDHNIRALEETGLVIAEADLVIPHQANGRMDEILSERYGWPRKQVFVNADRVGNTGSAAIWLALEEARRTLPPCGSALALGAEATKYLFAGFRYRAA